MSPLSPLSDAISELSAAGATAVQRGLTQASGGNLSARLDENSFVVTGAGTWLDALTDRDFSVLSMDGEVLSGHPKPSSEWKLHQRAYQERADVNAVIHVHPQHAVLLDALDIPVRLLTLDHAYYVRSVGSTPFFPNGSDDLADAAAAQLTEHDCVILGHHGCSTVGPSIEMAFRRALNLEEAAVMTYRAHLLGDTATAFPETALRLLHHS